MKKHSLNRTIWKYFLLFSFLILGFLWAFQVFFLPQFYKYSKTKDIKNVAKTIKDNKLGTNLESVINTLSFEKGVCVEVMDQNFTTLYKSSFLGKGCLTGKEEQIRYKVDFTTSGTEQATYELINPRFDNQTLVYAIKLDAATYAFINTSLEPIDSTVSILQEQLLIVTGVVLILSFIIAYFISSHISKPIVNINQAASRLATGEMNVVFDAGGKIEELNELATTLNYTRDELAKTDELRRDLMANVSHDLKTPLTMIKAYAEMSCDLHANDPQKRQKDMTTIVNEVDHLTGLVNDILDLSKLSADIDHLHYESFDLISLIEEILQSYEVLKEVESYHFHFSHPPKKILITADQKKIKQVIYNLINNAINYTGEDRLVTVVVEEQPKAITVSVKDTGKGIKEEDIPYIWDKYYKNEKKHKRNLVGTGLGLSIVKNILKQHHFEYGVTTKKDKGSCFYFIIPKEEA